GKDDALDRLSEALGIGRCLGRMGQKILGVEDDQSCRALHDLRVDQQAVLRGDIAVKRDLAKSAYAHAARQAGNRFGRRNHRDYSAAACNVSRCSCRTTPESGSNSPIQGLRSSTALVWA